MDGIILINKPKGPSSFRIVSEVRKLIGGGKVGHGGTLDPLATGVLVLLIGKATKQSASMLTSDKEYTAKIRLGVTTDTFDAEGTVLREEEVPEFSREEVEMILSSFQGEISQIPPPHSALKQRGRKLYELARKGIKVEPKPRMVKIYGIKLVDYHLPWLTLEVECSKGTYIRALARDIGERLCCGAHLAELTRTRVAGFRLDDCISPEELTRELVEKRIIEIGAKKV
jgi:tRNA pseudouridine55 synthase